MDFCLSVWTDGQPPNMHFFFQINSSELDAAMDATPINMPPEKLAPVFKKLRRKEKSLRLKAQELENKLEMSEIHNYSLVEENCDLKTEIEGLETEISEVIKLGKNPHFIQKFTYWKLQFLQNSPIWNLIFHKIHLYKNFIFRKIHIYKISFFTKFTFSKLHFS